MSDARSLLRSLDYSVLQQCMHCGLCLPTCPTYLETKQERHSPRGRIALMRSIADGDLEANRAFADEMAYCLGCLACTSACPAGVDYATLIETGRAEVERSGAASGPLRSLLRWVTLRFLLYRPWALRMQGRLIWIYESSGLQRMIRGCGLFKVLPRRLGEIERQTIKVKRRYTDALVAETERPRGPVRHRVAMLAGCIQDIAFSDVNRATVDVLLENGCEVVTPRAQHCCGSLHAHNGDHEGARHLARAQIDSIDPGAFDAIISNSAGCGSHLKHLDTLLSDDPVYAARAKAWTAKVKDIAEWLVEIGFRSPGPAPGPQAPVPLTYHEACHLCHGQKITAQPREILKALPGYVLHECRESTFCCGSAGTYSLTHPVTANWLRERKIGHIQSTGAEVVATANPGCQLHILAGYRSRDPLAPAAPRIVHPVVLLAEAYKAERNS